MLAKSYWSSIPGMRDHMTSKVKELPLHCKQRHDSETLTLCVCTYACVVLVKIFIKVNVENTKSYQGRIREEGMQQSTSKN